MAYHMVPGVDGSSSYPWVGLGCVQLLGVEPAELMADSGIFWSMVHPCDRTSLKLAKLKAIRQGEAFRERCRVITRSGDLKLIEISGYKLPLSLCEFPVLWNLQAVDVSDQQRLIEEINELKAALCEHESNLKKQAKSLGEAHAAIVRLSTKDALTGVDNRLSFDHALWREVAVAQRHGRPLALIFIKLMGLLDLNRAQGTLAGDQALTRFAAVLSHCLASCHCLANRHSVGRYSGVCFCVLLPEADDHAIDFFLHHLTTAFSSDNSLSKTGLTIRVGADFCKAEDSCDSLLQRAESRMLQRAWD